jgi:hypothetical protein
MTLKCCSSLYSKKIIFVASFDWYVINIKNKLVKQDFYQYSFCANFQVFPTMHAVHSAVLVTGQSVSQSVSLHRNLQIKQRLWKILA